LTSAAGRGSRLRIARRPPPGCRPERASCRWRADREGASEKRSVRASVIAARLLGRHVVDGAEHGAATVSRRLVQAEADAESVSSPAGWAARSWRDRSRGSSPGARAHHQVHRFEVAVDDPFEWPTRARRRPGWRCRAAARPPSAGAEPRGEGSPSSSSMTMKCCPRAARSRGRCRSRWLSAEAARASRWKRSSIGPSAGGPRRGTSPHAAAEPRVLGSYTTPFRRRRACARCGSGRRLVDQRPAESDILDPSRAAELQVPARGPGDRWSFWRRAPPAARRARMLSLEASAIGPACVLRQPEFQRTAHLRGLALLVGEVRDPMRPAGSGSSRAARPRRAGRGRCGRGRRRTGRVMGVARRVRIRKSEV